MTTQFRCKSDAQQAQEDVTSNKHKENQTEDRLWESAAPAENTKCQILNICEECIWLVNSSA